jgi:hypothetical protein
MSSLATHVPAGGTVLIVGSSLPEKLDLPGRMMRPFPWSGGGSAAQELTSDLAGIAQLEAARVQGASVLVVTGRAASWFRRFPQLAYHLRRTYPFVLDSDEHSVMDLQRGLPESDSASLALIEGAVGDFYGTFGHCPAILDWGTGLQLELRVPQYSVFSPVVPDCVLPYLDRTIDVVALPAGDAVRLADARRAASAAVITVPACIGDPGSDAGTGSRVRPPVQAAVEWTARTSRNPLPSISVVAPLTDDPALVGVLLDSLRRTVPLGLELEIILAAGPTDSDPPAPSVAGVSRTRVVRDAGGVSLGAALTRAGVEATGEILVFFPAGSVILNQWWLYVLRTFLDHPDAAVVGGKVVYANGHAAFALEVDGAVVDPIDARGYGDDPAFGYVREVDGYAGTFVAVRRNLISHADLLEGQTFGEISSTLCRIARSQGGGVYFQPRAELIFPVWAEDVRPSGSISVPAP